MICNHLIKDKKTNTVTSRVDLEHQVIIQVNNLVILKMIIILVANNHMRDPIRAVANSNTLTSGLINCLFSNLVKSVFSSQINSLDSNLGTMIKSKRDTNKIGSKTFKIPVKLNLLEVNIDNLNQFKILNLNLLVNIDNLSQFKKKSLKILGEKRNQNTRNIWKIEGKSRNLLLRRQKISLKLMMEKKNLNTKNTWRVEVQGRRLQLHK